MNNIVEYINVLPKILCDDIIDLFLEERKTIEIKKVKIFTNNDTWWKIEQILFNELLIKIKTYKIGLLKENTSENSELLILLNNDLYTKLFDIEEYDKTESDKFVTNYNRVNNRFNVLNYIYYLNSVENGGEIHFDNGIIIKAETGKLVLFPDNMDYKYKVKLPVSNEQYIIFGQLCYKNIVT